ncbi:MAG: hypothetical protein METHP_00597 [Methanoregula sp. SKADARSKE-2]|nr:MAG: hypothetical protein METHP_00597 [Methanoregula sp. SKADARSKE-2]
MDDLWARYRKWKGLDDRKEQIVTQGYYIDDARKTSRYYQMNAINLTVEAIANGQNRVLLVMATGTGKTYTAFQIIWRLWKAGVKKRILFLAERNILVDQTKKNDFKPFGSQMTKITNRQVDKSYEIYLSLYQAVTGNEEERNIYKQFSRDFFDLIVVDECHRGSAADDAMWREILDYFKTATHIGLTATPKETKHVSNVHYFGEPVYVYSLKQGIEDGFLACAIENIRKTVKTIEDEGLLQSSIHGVEKKPMPHLLCVTNMMLHGIDVPIQIKHDNTLARPLKDYSARDRVDVIVTNPPFGGMEEDGIEQNFPSMYQTRETADLFLVLIMQILKDGGRTAIVLPDGTLFGEGVKSRIKEKLLTECNLHTIVRLPNGVFAPYTGIKTNLLFFEKGKPTKEIWYYEHTYPEGVKSYNKTKPIRIEEFEPEKEWWTNRTENEHAWRVPVEQVLANGYVK